MTGAQQIRKTTRIPGLPVEERLLSYIDRLGQDRRGRIAIRLHLSLLAEHNRREAHIRAAINTFEELTRIFEAAVFTLGNNDLILVCNGANVLKVDHAVQKIRYLFSEDPLFEHDSKEGTSRFCTWYNIENEFDVFRQDAKNCINAYKLYQATERKRRQAPVNTAPTPQSLVGMGGSGMSLTEYANLETLLAAADIANLIRQQPICALTREDPPQRIFDEIYVSIADLQKTLAPGKDLTADRWIFQRLTRLLDRRVLKALNGGQRIAPTKSISLNLNVATLLTPEFEQFDRDLRVGARGSIMIELNLVDIFADIGAYAYARDLVQDRGYRICVDGLTHLTATFVDRAKLGADMVKIHWSPDIAADPAGNQVAALATSVREAGAARVVLCRCDDGRAVCTGLNLGIAMFQGRHVDNMLQKGLGAGQAA